MRQVYLGADSTNAIEKLSFYSPNEGYVAFDKWIGYTTDSGRSFTSNFITLTNVNYGNYTNIDVTLGFIINGVKAFDKNNLLVYGHYNAVPSILQSTDGGGSYTLVFYSQYNPLQVTTGVTDMAFPLNEDTGYAVDNDRILMTTNKGASWTVSYTYQNASFDHLETVDDNNLIAMSTTRANNPSNVLFKTADGGTTWLRVYYNLLPSNTLFLTYAYFLDANTGWLSAVDNQQNQYFYKTVNGGAAWTQQNDIQVTPFTCDRMHFVDVNTGYALVAPFRVYKTLNSGGTWEPLSSDNSFTYLGYTNNDLQCLSASQAWAGGGHGFLELTSNGGAPIPIAYFKIDTTGLNSSGSVNLINYSQTGYTYQWLVNGQAVSGAYDATYTHGNNEIDTVQLITSSGGLSDTTTKYQSFFQGPLPVTNFYYPHSGSTGTFVTLRGQYFSQVSAVSFGGTPAASFTVLSDTVITAVVAGGNTGMIAVRFYYGNVPVGAFTYNPPPASLPPAISSFVPGSAPIGSTVTISGSGFGTSPAQNGVFFGSILAVVSSASPTQIVCTVPAGASYGPIAILNRSNGLTGESPLVFGVTFADSATNFTTHSFTPAWVLPTNSIGTPMRAFGMDIDGDGKPDLVADLDIGQGDSMSVFRNTSAGGRISFAQPVNVGYTYFPMAGFIAIDDLDGDGLPDMVAPTNDDNLYGNHVWVFRNTSTPGHISFGDNLQVAAGRGTVAIAVGDLDRDGRNDIIAAAFTDSALSVARNTSVPGALSFATTQTYKAGGLTNQLAIGDLDGDGWPDVVAYNYAYPANGSLACFRNTSIPGTISFAPFITIVVPGNDQNYNSVRITDFDGDGKPDIILINENYICIVRNNSTPGNFSFQPPVLLSLGNTGWGGVLSNFSGSTLPDILASDGFDRQLRLVKNTSTPGVVGMDSLLSFSGNSPYYIIDQAVGRADFDGDGKPDLIATSETDNAIAVYKNSVGLPVTVSFCTSMPLGDTLASDVSGATYQWQMDNGSGFATLSDNVNLSGTATSTLQFINLPPSWSGYQFRCLVGSLKSSTFKLEPNATPNPGLLLLAPDSSICYGSTVTFSATDTVGMTGYQFQWQIDGRDTGYLTYNQMSFANLKDQDQVRVILGYPDVCGLGELYDTSRQVTIHVSQNPDSVLILVSDTSVCAGAPVTFAATAVNPGATPVYDWQVNGVSQGVDSTVFTSAALTNGSQVKAVLTSSTACAYPTTAGSNILTMTVHDTSSLSVTITASTNDVCQGTNILFTARPINKGAATSYQWLVNGVDSGTNSDTFGSAFLHNQDKVQCLLVSPFICRAHDSATSNSVVMSVNDLVIPAVNVNTADTTVCSRVTVVFTAQPTGGGDAPGFQWWKNGVPTGNNSPSYSAAQLSNGDAITVTMTSSATCAQPDTATSKPLVMTVEPLPVITLSGASAVAAGVADTLNATVLSAGTNPVYEWQDSTITHSWQDINTASAGAALVYTPLDSGDAVRCIVTSDAGCTTASIAFPISIHKMVTDTNNTSNMVRFYPNPVITTLYVEDEAPSDPIFAIAIFSNNGVKVLAVNSANGQTKYSIDVAGLSPGIYYLRLNRNSGKSNHFIFLKR